MKKILIITLFTVSIISTSCKHTVDTTPNARVIAIDKIENKALEANYQEDVRIYQEESNEKIIISTKRVAKFKASREYGKANKINNYKNLVAIIEQKNSDLKKRIDSCASRDKYKWEMYKIEFSNDLNNISKQLDELTISNKNKV